MKSLRKVVEETDKEFVVFFHGLFIYVSIIIVYRKIIIIIAFPIYFRSKIIISTIIACSSYPIFVKWEITFTVKIIVIERQV